MISNVESTQEFLREVHLLAEAGKVQLVPRDKNMATLIEMGIALPEVKALLIRLTVNNYVSGPEADRDRVGEVWVFGASLAKTLLYIKLKLATLSHGETVLVLSFHPAEYPLKFALRE